MTGKVDGAMLEGFGRMDWRHGHWRRIAVAIGALLTWTAPVGAHLGGEPADVEVDTLALQGTLSTATLVDYDVHQIKTAAGQTVREYLTRGGSVFAVAWNGPVPPDLAQLLGPYFASYAAGLAALDHPGLKRSVRIATPTLIVESSGHLRAYAGRAYLPALIPAGVSVAEIR